MIKSFHVGRGLHNAPPVSAATEFETLLAQIDSDGMVMRRVIADAEDVVFFKSVLEAYPGVAAVHAERRSDEHDSGPFARPRRLVVATTPGLSAELDELLEGLRAEMALVVEGVDGGQGSRSLD